MQQLPPIESPNGTIVPNTILDVWMPQLSDAEFKVVMFIARKTFGWHKPEDAISLNQLSAGTNKAMSTVLGVVKSLLDKGCLVKRPQSGRKCHGTNVYSLNIRQLAKGGTSAIDVPPTSANDVQGTSAIDVPYIGSRCNKQQHDKKQGNNNTGDASAALLSAGVAPGRVDGLVRKYGRTRCCEVVAWLPYASNVQEPAAWVVAALKGNYTAPLAYVTAQRKREAAVLEQQQQQQRERERARTLETEARERAQREAAIAALPHGRFEQLAAPIQDEWRQRFPRAPIPRATLQRLVLQRDRGEELDWPA